MSQTYQHVCQVADGGCGRTYSSLEADPYFCKDCIQARKALYAQVDRKVRSTPRKHIKSDYEIFMEQSKTAQRVDGDGVTVISSRMKV